MNVRLPKSAKIILAKLASDGPMTPQSLSDKFNLSPRTVSFALRRLTQHRLCRRVPNLHDMRKPHYSADIDRMKELQVNLDQIRAIAQIHLKPI